MVLEITSLLPTSLTTGVLCSAAGAVVLPTVTGAPFPLSLVTVLPDFTVLGVVGLPVGL